MLGKITRPNGTTIVTDSVGLLNIYEYQMSYTGTTYSNGYLNNGLSWYTLTPYSAFDVRYVNGTGNVTNFDLTNAQGIRPSIVLKSNIKIVDGNGTIDNPYRLEGDNDTNLSGTLLNTRYSGEYIIFGKNGNNLYRIVSHEAEGLIKITSAGPLKSSKSFIKSVFGMNKIFSSTNTLGIFLNEEYLTKYVGDDYANMIEDTATWYLGIVGTGDSYKLAKYIDASMSEYNTSTTSKVGLLRFGELMAGQFDRYYVKGQNSTIADFTTNYWLLTQTRLSYVRISTNYGGASYNATSNQNGIKPSLNLKSNVIITSGDGTLQNPFNIELSN